MSSPETTIHTTYLAEVIHRRNQSEPGNRSYVLLGDQAGVGQTKEVIIAEALGGVAAGLLTEGHVHALMINFGRKNHADQAYIITPLAQEAVFKSHLNNDGCRALLGNTVERASEGTISPREYMTRHQRLDFLFEEHRLTLLTTGGFVAQVKESVIDNPDLSDDTETFEPKAYELEPYDMAEFSGKVDPAATHYAFQMDLVTRQNGFLELQSDREIRHPGLYNAAGNFVPLPLRPQQ